MDSLEYEEYDDLTRNAGWQRFTAYVEQLWGAPGTSNGEMFRNAVAQAASETADADATAKLRQIVIAQREIQRVMAYPGKRVQELKPRELRPDEFVGSRRGGL